MIPEGFLANLLVDGPSIGDLDELVRERGGRVEDEQTELVVVSNRIAGQFVEVVAVVAGQVLAGRADETLLTQLRSALEALRRLAVSSGDPEHVELVNEGDVHVQLFLERHGSGRGRARFVDALRAWLPRYGAYLGGESERRLVGLVEFGGDDIPLFDELSRIRGIGPRRLARLYSAGLFSAETVAGAQPSDIAAVTGLPIALAEAVVDRTREWVEERRRQSVLEMRRRVAEFKRVLDEMDATGVADLRAAALAAISEMRTVVEQFETGDAE